MRQVTPNILDELMPTTSETSEITAGLRWDYDQLGDADADYVRRHAVEIKRNERKANEHVLEAGLHLIAVKERLDHGQWGDWLEVEFAMSERTAQRMMAAAAQFDGKSDTVSLLGQSVLYLLAGDSVPEPAREAVIDAAKSGERVTKAKAKAIIAKHKPAPETRADGLTPEQEREFIRRYFNLDELLEVGDPDRRMEWKIETSSSMAASPWRWETRSDVQVWHESHGSYWGRECDARYTHAKIKKMGSQALAEMKSPEKPAPPPSLPPITIATPAQYGTVQPKVEIVPADERPLPDWVTAPDMRVSAASRLINVYRQAMTTENEYGELTGCFADWLTPKRELQKCIDRLERLIAVLEGKQAEKPEWLEVDE